MNRYFVLLFICFTITLPLEFAFKAKIYQRTLVTLRSLWLPALTYIVWDYFATKEMHWRFSSDHILGIKYFSIPLEEFLFFIIIPICALLTYESLSNILVFKKIKNTIWFAIIAIFTLTGSIIYIYRLNNYNLNPPERTFPYYTLITACLCILLVIYYKKQFRELLSSNIYLLTISICIFFMLIINGLLTVLDDPVVIYRANLGPRLYLDIPFEDFFYGIALITWVLIRFNKIKQIQNKET